MPVATDAAGPVEVALVLDDVAELPVLLEDVVLAVETSFAPHTPFWTAAPRLDLR